MHPQFETVLIVTVALFGLIAGSFLNVVICRYGTGKSIVHPPSHCPHCNTRLKAIDLIPVFSFILLRGRCRYCRASVSVRYAVIEMLTALLFVVSFFYLQFPLLFIKYLVIFAILLVIAAIDLDCRRIPNLLVLVLMAWSLLWQFVYPELTLLAAGTGLLAGGGSFLLIAAASRGGMGGGDIKLMAALGFTTGWPWIIMIFLFSFLIGALVGVFLLVLRKKTRKSALPFGPFIVLSFLITLIWGEQIWLWYLSLL